MTSNFRHVALIGKYQASSAGAIGESSRQALHRIARFLQHQGCSVAIEAETASNTGLLHYPSLTVEDIGARCDLGLVVGGDGTMLGIGRRLARVGTPLVGINQGRLGFITDIPFDTYQATLPPMLEGDYEEDSRPLIQAFVMRAGQGGFEAPAMNEGGVGGDGGTARGGRRPLRGQSAGGRADHRIAHRIDRLFAVRWRPDAASVDSWLGSGSDRAAYPVPPPHRAVGRHRGGGRSRQRPGCQRQLRYAVAGLVAPWRQDFAQPVSALRALFAPARLELLRHLAQETALERRRPLTMALRRITLRDFVIVQALELELDAGFTVLTGETGAGKSILIDALQLALGARAEAGVGGGGEGGVVGEGAEKTDICAEFDCPAHVLPWLQEAGFDGDDLLLLRRTVDAQGKSRAWINATPATAAQLRALGDMLLDIHGQHAWQSLTRPESVRGLLDAFAAVSAAETAARWAQWRADQKALKQARPRPVGSKSVSACSGKSAKSTNWRQRLANGMSSMRSTGACRMPRRWSMGPMERSGACKTTRPAPLPDSHAPMRCCKPRNISSRSSPTWKRFFHRAWRKPAMCCARCNRTCGARRSILSALLRSMPACRCGWAWPAGTNARPHNCPRCSTTGKPNCASSIAPPIWIHCKRHKRPAPKPIRRPRGRCPWPAPRLRPGYRRPSPGPCRAWAWKGESSRSR